MKPATLALVGCGALLVLGFLVSATTARGSDEPPLPDEEDPERRSLPDGGWEIVPPPDRPGYAPVTPGGAATGEIMPEPGGGYALEHGAQYRMWFTIDSFFAGLAGPPVVMSKLRDAGVASPRAWKLEDGSWQAEGIWDGPSGIMPIPPDVTISKLERIG